MESYDIQSPAFESDALPKPRHARRRVASDENQATVSARDNNENTPQQDKADDNNAYKQNKSVRQEQQPIAGGNRQKVAKERPSTVKTTRNSLKDSGVIRMITDGRMAMFLGIVLLVIATYLCITFISYITNGAEDQSMIQSYAIGNMIDQTEKINNIGGPIGAWLSETLISKSFGIGSIVIVFYVAALGLSLTGTRKFRFFPLTFKCLLTTITISIVLGMVTYKMPSVMFWGGEHGYYINSLLAKSTGVFGMIGVCVILVAAVILIFLDEIARFTGFVNRKITAMRERRDQRRIERLASEIEAENEEEKEQASRQTNRNEAPKRPTAPLTNPGEEDVEMATETETTTEERETIKIEPPKPSPLDHDPYFDHHHQVSEPSVMNDAAVKIPAAHVTTSDVAEVEPEPVIPAKSIQTEVETVTTIAAPIETAENDGPNLYDPTAELSHYQKPPLDLLHQRPVKANSVDEEEQEENKDKITRVLNNFGIEISKIVATVGPTITLYEIVPAEGVRINKIRSLEDDIALSLSAIGIRIIAPMPGKGTIGIEVPNKDAQIVSIRSILASKKFQETTAALPMAMGATISNDVYIADLTKMPHLLVAGSTGMGKSVGLNTIIASLLYKKHPAEIKFVLIDPKMVEFSLYSRIERHYLAKLPDEEEAIITDPNKVVPSLNSLCVEMDNRYELLKKANVRGIKEYNDKFVQRRLNPENGHQYLPYIVVIIDEFADLIMTAGKEVETPIARIAQKARAVGIHIILATQRPSANIITGVIRANFPGRIAFRVTQQLESRIILDQGGANQLIGRGDMLFSRDGAIERVQCAFIDTDEVESICDWISKQTGYEDAYLLPEYVAPASGGSQGGSERMTDRDPLFESAARMVIESGIGSTTALQRRYNIGFPRAGKIMDQLERAGIVGPAQGGKPRQVLMDSTSLDRFLEICGGNA